LFLETLITGGIKMNTILSTNRKFNRMFANILSILVILAMAFPAMGNVYAQEPTPKVGLVVTESGIADNGFNLLAHQGLQRAESDIGITGSLYTPADQNGYNAMLQQCADEGNELCIAVGFPFGVSLANAARAYPDTKWAIVDWSYPDCWEGAVEGVDCGSFTEISNVRGLRFNEKQAGYLAGVLAAGMTASNVVGAVGGIDIPPVVAFVEGYRNGAQCTNPAVNVLTSYTGTFSDPGLGATTAQEMIAQGADVIFGAAGSTGDGAITYSAQNGQWAIGVDADQYLTVFGDGSVAGSDKLLSSAMKRVASAVYQTIADFVYGAFTPSTILYDLATDGVGLAPFHETDDSIPQSVKDNLETVKQGIINRTVNIDDPCAPLPTPGFIAFPENDAVEGWEWPEGTTVTLTIDNAPSDFVRTATAAVTTWGDPRTYFRIDFGDAYNLKVGDQVTLTGEDGTTRTHTVQNLSITGVDIDADTVAGTANPGTQLQVWAHQQSDPPVDVTVDENGKWLADLTDVYDITPDTAGRSQLYVDGNATAVDWAVPFIWADPLCECINGWNWFDGDTITLQVFDQDGNQFTLQTPTQTYSANGGVFFDLNADGINLQPGHKVVMSNGTTTKELIISKLVVKEMNPVANTISGVFDPNLPLFVHSEDQVPLNYEFNDDQWVATFDPSFSIDRFGEAYQPDEDGDKTGMGWDGIPNFMRYDIYAFDIQSRNIQRITMLDGAGEYNPSWSPNGKKVAHDVVYWDGSQDLYLTDVATHISTLLVEGGNDGVWSQNGKWIAFDLNSNLYLISSTGGVPTLARENAVSADWAPSGKRLVFQQPSDGSIRTVAVDGGKGGETIIATNGANPSWSPDGNWIVYEKDGDIGKVQVNVQGTPFGDPIQVTSGPFNDGQPTWSTDSQTIVYHSGFTSDWDLWTIPATGGMGTWLNGAPDVGDYDPAYAKNSSNIAYASFSPDGQAARTWVAAYTHDAGTWTEGAHAYHFEATWNGGSEMSQDVPFNVSDEAQSYDGFGLLRPGAVRVAPDCAAIDTISPNQPTRFLAGWPTINEMTYDEAEAFFDSLTARAIWDDGQSAELVRHEIIPFNSDDWFQYACTFTSP
jgi:basic membrane protein A and related proteins